MSKLILIRHGESEWNKEDLFTGWTDVGLTERGIEQAEHCGDILKEKDIKFDIAFTSYLKRAIKTLWIVMEKTNREWVETIRAWQLNERHYGALQGKNKKKTAEEFGEEQVFIWRRSYDVRPPALNKDDPRYPGNDERYRGIKDLPTTECLKDTFNRVVPYFKKRIMPEIKRGKNVLVSAHGNSLRALIKYLDNISDEEISKLNIPYAIPIVYEFEKKKIAKKYYLGNPEEIKKLEEEIKNQSKK